MQLMPPNMFRSTTIIGQNYRQYTNELHALTLWPLPLVMLCFSAQLSLWVFPAKMWVRQDARLSGDVGSYVLIYSMYIHLCLL
jgi:hypothetical protein